MWETVQKELTSDRLLLSELKQAFNLRHSTALWLAIVAGLICWGYAVTQFLLVGDDWSLIFPQPGLSPPTIRVNLVNGRWLAYLIHRLTGDASFAPFLTGLFAVGVLVAIAIALGAAGGLPTGPYRALFAVLFIVNPLHAEFVIFKILHIPEGLGMLMATAAAIVVASAQRINGRRLLLVTALVTLCFASYQPSALFFGMGLAAVYLMRRVTGLEQDGSRGWKLLLIGPAIYGAATLVYVGTVSLVWRITGLQALSSGEYSLDSGYTGPGEILAQARWALSNWVDFWRIDTGGYTAPLKLLALGLVVVGALAALRAGSLAWRSVTLARRAAEVGVVTLVTILGPFLFWFVRDEPSLRYNVISSLAVGIALFGSLGPLIVDGRYSSAPQHRLRLVPWRNVLVALPILLIVGQLFLVTRDLGGHFLSNQRDLAFANRLLDRIEKHPSYEALIGTPLYIGMDGRFDPYFDARPFRYLRGAPATSILGCGAVDCQTTRIVSALNLLAIDGTVFRYRDPAQIAREAGLDLDTMPEWPAYGSVAITEHGVVIKAR